MERDDSANLYVLEGIVISMILLGAAYAVSTLQDSSVENVRPRNALGRIVDDALTVLAGLDDGNGTQLLDSVVLEQLHCTEDAVASADDCDLRRSRNLSIKVEHYIPLGGGYAVILSNGADSREIYASPIPRGEAVSASRTFAPEWNTSFMFTDFDCYPTDVDVNVTLIPIDRGHLVWAEEGKVLITEGVTSTDYTGERATTQHWWNVTLGAAPRPDAASVRGNVTRNGTMTGLTAYTADCGHASQTDEIRHKLWDVSFAPAASKVPIGESIGFSADLTPLTALGITIDSATVTVYEPLPTTAQGADTWIEAGGPFALSGPAASMSGTYTPPATSLYGAHPALLRIQATLGGESFELRKAALVDVALPTGEVPYEAPYRVSLQAWMGDWG